MSYFISACLRNDDVLFRVCNSSAMIDRFELCKIVWAAEEAGYFDDDGGFLDEILMCW